MAVTIGRLASLAVVTTALAGFSACAHGAEPPAGVAVTHCLAIGGAM